MSADPREDGKKKKRKTKQKPVQEQVPPQAGVTAAAADGNSKFARALGSVDYSTREKGLQALSKWLQYKDQVSEIDMLKLWKGIFFCFWHSDKEPVQADLAQRLAGLLPCLQPRMAQLYWAGLLATLRREWFAMDHHRLNKFLMLVRKFVNALFKRLAAANWGATTISSLTADLPLAQSTLIPCSGTMRSLGLSYHLADIWLQELKKVADEQPVPGEAVVLLLEPFVAVLESAGEQPLIDRVKESVFDTLINDLTAAAAQTDNSSDSSTEACTYCKQLDAQQLASQLFARGAAEGVKARNRQALYSVSKDLERMLGKRMKKAAANAAATAADDGDGTGQQQQQHHGSANQLQVEQQHQRAAVFGKRKKQKRHQPDGQQQHIQQQQQQTQATQKQQLDRQQVNADDQVATAQLDLAAKPTKRKRHPADQQQADGQVTMTGVAATGSRPGHKRVAGKQQHLPLLSPAAASPTAQATAAAAANTTGIDAATPITVSTQKTGKKKRKQYSDAAAAATIQAAGPTEAVTGVSNGASAKKGVIINLKHNVYFAHGAPVPPAEVRTPEKAKPKGSALKSSSRLQQPSTAPAKQPKSRFTAGRKAVTPNSVPRVRAAAFF